MSLLSNVLCSWPHLYHFHCCVICSQDYIVRLDSSLPRSAYDYKLPEISFTANVTYRHFTFKFDPQVSHSYSVQPFRAINLNSFFHSQRKPQEQELSQSSFLVLPLSLLIVFLSYNYQKVSQSCYFLLRISIKLLDLLPQILPMLAQSVGSLQSLLASSASSYGPSSSHHSQAQDNFTPDLFSDSSNASKKKAKVRKA